MDSNSLSEIAKAMTIALTPVFLITAIAALLTTMAARFGRVVDRIRTLLREGKFLYNTPLNYDHAILEINALYKRAKLLRITMIFTATSIFFVCFTVAMIFASLLFSFSSWYIPAFSFICALLSLLIGVGLFIEDFAISLSTIKSDIRTRAPDVVKKNAEISEN